MRSTGLRPIVSFVTNRLRFVVSYVKESPYVHRRVQQLVSLQVKESLSACPYFMPCIGRHWSPHRHCKSYTPKKLSIRAGSSFHDLVEVTVSYTCATCRPSWESVYVTGLTVAAGTVPVLAVEDSERLMRPWAPDLSYPSRYLYCIHWLAVLAQNYSPLRTADPV